MGYFWDGHYQNEDVWFRVSLDNDKPDDVEKHYMLSPDFQSGPYVPEISSYKDLQSYSMKTSACIGREKPVYHLKEVIPPVMKTAYDPHPGKTVDSYVYYVDYWPWPDKGDKPGYYVITHAGGYEDFVYFSNDDWRGTYSYCQVRGEVYKRVRDGNEWGYAYCSTEYYCNRHGTSTTVYNYDDLSCGWAYALSSQCYGMAVAALASLETRQDVEAHPDYQYCIGFISDADCRRYYYTGSWISEADLFDPQRDLELVSANHTIPVGLEPKLCSEALANTSFNSNSIANLLELFDLANNIRKGDLGSILLDFKKGGKVAADAWLKYRYVYCTTKSDLEELQRYASNGVPTVCRAGGSGDNGLMHVKIKLAPKSNQLGKMVDRLTSKGLAPNAYNMWDLVPFSFVVDWFVGIGDFLEGITQYGRCAAFDIMSVTTSWTWKDTLTKGSTKAKFIFYERTVSPSVPAYVPYVETRSASGETILKRCADTVALIGG